MCFCQKYAIIQKVILLHVFWKKEYMQMQSMENETAWGMSASKVEYQSRFVPNTIAINVSDVIVSEK